MKAKILLISALSVLAAYTATAQDAPEEQGLECTSIVVGRLASTDGSVITSHTCDGVSHTWVQYVPAADHKRGEVTRLRKNFRKTISAADTAEIEIVGEIPQVRHTYAYLNTGYPSLNEKQVGIGETTFTGPKNLINKNSPLVIEELARLALERCNNARDAVRLMGSLAEKYGYGDGGECLTVADPKEAWFFEITGIGSDKSGAAWVAQRVPDDEVGISANIPRISKIDRNDKDFFMASDNLEQVAIDNGLWDGEGEFCYYKAYHGTYGSGKNFKEREWFVLSTLAPSLALTMDMDELPFSVKPEAKVDVRKVMEYFRGTYEGTELDMCKNVKEEVEATDSTEAYIKISPIANPWLTTTTRKTLNTIAPGTIEFSRTLAVAWCSYSTVIQLRGWLPDGIGGICWWAPDNPAQSPRIPLFAGADALPQAFEVCGQKKYKADCVLWQFRRANKLATLSWQTNKKNFMKKTLSMEDKAFEGLPALEQRYKEASKKDRASILNDYIKEVYGRDVECWEELEATLWHKHGRGF